MISAELLLAALVAALIALLSTPAFARLGLWGIKRWLEHDTIVELESVNPAWWLAAAVLGLVMAATLAPEPGNSRALFFLACLLVGIAAALLVQLARIDARCRLLPDPLTLCLLVSGLVFHALMAPGSLPGSILGALLGYGLLWGLATLFRWHRNIEAMGRGDFAMAAGIGAWLGWQALPIALVFACGSALVFVLLQRLAMRGPSKQSFLSTELAFGPALSAGTALAWVALG
jgi:prepilin signal peptidase PulO-like enzyme (type II secretory pathway)